MDAAKSDDAELKAAPKEVQPKPDGKRYKPGPKSRKRFLEISPETDTATKKQKEGSSLLDTFKVVLTVEEFINTFKTKDITDTEKVVMFKLFKIWFKTLDIRSLKCAECSKTLSDTWDLIQTSSN